MLRKSRKQVLFFSLFIGLFLALNATIQIEKNDFTKTESLSDLETKEEVEIKKPSSFDELLNDDEFRGLRDSLYLESKMFVESGYDESAFNKKELATGILQIRPVMVKECNNILKAEGINKQFSLKDCYDVDKSREIYEIVQHYHNPKYDLFTASSLWNGGHKPNQLKPKTLNNVKKYHKKIMDNMRDKYVEFVS